MKSSAPRLPLNEGAHSFSNGPINAATLGPMSTWRAGHAKQRFRGPGFNEKDSIGRGLRA